MNNSKTEYKSNYNFNVQSYSKKNEESILTIQTDSDNFPITCDQVINHLKKLP